MYHDVGEILGNVDICDSTNMQTAHFYLCLTDHHTFSSWHAYTDLDLGLRDNLINEPGRDQECQNRYYPDR